MHPDWLGSPQHFVAGLVLSGAVMLVARRWGVSRWLAVVLAISVTALAELLVEIAEYPLFYSDRFHQTAYYDTVADMVATMVGAVVAALAITVVSKS